jgi:hypothetical protein
MVGENLGRPSGNGLPRGFREPITMSATPCPERTNKAGAGKGGNVWEKCFGEMPGATCSGGSEGVGEHVRTRSHPGEAVPDEIADFKRSAPNEENLFLLPDRPGSARAPFRSSIQPFDLMSRRHPLCVVRSRSD